MRVLKQVALCCLLAGYAMAQRGGGGGSHGGGGGGGFHGGGSMGGGGFRGGGGGFSGGGFRGGVGGFNGFRGGFGYGGYGFGRGFYGGYYGWPYWGYGAGLGYWPYYGGYGYPYYDYSYPYYDSTYTSGYTYPAYQQSPMTVVYPPQSTVQTYTVPRPGMHEYDQYGQEIQPQGAAGTADSGGAVSLGSPVYLIAFKDKNIRAAAAYWVAGQTLHYVTLEHEEKQAPLADVDRDLSARLNRERHVQFQLPQ